MVKYFGVYTMTIIQEQEDGLHIGYIIAITTLSITMGYFAMKFYKMRTKSKQNSRLQMMEFSEAEMEDLAFPPPYPNESRAALPSITHENDGETAGAAMLDITTNVELQTAEQALQKAVRSHQDLIILFTFHGTQAGTLEYPRIRRLKQKITTVAENYLAQPEDLRNKKLEQAARECITEWNRSKTRLLDDSAYNH